jgi:dolichol-phosphate mannosyltransferase
VVDAFLKLQDRDRHYLFILHWLGYNATDIEYEHAERHSGRSSYSIRALLKHAFDGIFFQTTILLRWIVYLGFWISASGLAFTVYFIYLYFAYSIYPGWTSLAVLILLIGGFIISSTGIAGLYIGKIFEQVKGRPLYVVDQALNREET